MALNSSQKDIILQRRMIVARARVQGITEQGIVKSLEKQGFINPKTGVAWTHVTIHTDIKAIEKAWREEMLKATSEHKARILAELAEVKRRGWSEGDIDLVLKALAQERAVIGADAPTKITETDEKGRSIYYFPDDVPTAAAWTEKFAPITNSDDLDKCVNGNGTVH